jgi:uncharacterized cupredoxin-like copper-binding protein
MKATLVFVGILVAVVVASATIGLITYSPASLGDVSVSLRDYRISMPTRLTTGRHTFGVSNDGHTPHEFVMFRTNLPAHSLPLDENGNVNEDSPLLASVADSGSGLNPGKSRAVKASSLDPGHYVAVCNLPGHYRLGMTLDVTVAG